MCCITRKDTIAALVTETRQPLAGATVNFQGQHGRTPLHKAAEKAFPVLIKALCEARADPDSRDHFGALPQKKTVPLKRTVGVSANSARHNMIVN